MNASAGAAKPVLVTDRTRFDIFEVRNGVPVDQAITTATCIVDSLRLVAGSGVEDGLSSEVAWLLEQNLAMVKAILHSIEGASEINPHG